MGLLVIQLSSLNSEASLVSFDSTGKASPTFPLYVCVGPGNKYPVPSTDRGEVQLRSELEGPETSSVLRLSAKASWKNKE